MKAYQPKPDKWFEVMVRLTGKDKLCQDCCNHYKPDDDRCGWCEMGFYPIMSDGQNCPYYKKGEEML